MKMITEMNFKRSQHILVESDITFKPLPDIAKMYFKLDLPVVYTIVDGVFSLAYFPYSLCK